MTSAEDLPAPVARHHDPIAYGLLLTIGAPRASAFIVLVPLLGQVLSAWLLGESVGGFVIGGTAVVLAGLWLVQTTRPAAHRQPAIS